MPHMRLCPWSSGPCPATPRHLIGRVILRRRDLAHLHQQAVEDRIGRSFSPSERLFTVPCDGSCFAVYSLWGGRHAALAVVAPSLSKAIPSLDRGKLAVP